MKNVKNALLSALVLFNLLIVGCSKDDEVYEGSNKVLITAKGNSTLTIGETQEVTVNVVFTNKSDKNLPLNVVFTNKTNTSANNALEVVGTPTLKAQQNIATFNVKLKSDFKTFKDNIIETTVTFTDTQYKVVAPLKIIVKPAIALKDLTPAQITLLEGYKAKGMDVSSFIGKINVTTNVISHAGGYLTPYENEWKKEYKGVTVITLSEKATADKPVLKMVSNAMGCNELFHKVMRDETIENNQYWLAEGAGPNYAKSMKLLNWNKNSNETFGTALDNIRIEAVKNNVSKINYVGKNPYDKDLTVVPFDFSYTAWDRLQKLYKEKNAEAIELYGVDGTSNPNYYLNNTTIEDDWDYSRAVTGEIDFKKNTMKFSFVFQHTNGGDYIWIDAVYTK